MKVRTLLTVLLIVVCTHVQAQQGFILGYSLGSSEKQISDSSVIYIAPDAVMKTVTDVMLIKMVGQSFCNNIYYGLGVAAGRDVDVSLGEMFARIAEKLPKKQRTVLQITRYPNREGCSQLWFSYIEK